ncbi:hypothetical protein C8A01DRAFT_35114 [Parachaetomium inaequale]|uniref:Uncharacterized protein n=1 Tax=Parachaetomium inaequale TaxID=2588326 RepID=A0AAN6PH10_9PEZI|nr:hypothetical protein C8A01DRAFT_35114 [Parachaetomium inaequale]
MVRTTQLVAVGMGVALPLVHADVYKMCKDNKCQDCPVGLTNAGTGYPNCVTYDSDTVFFNSDYPGSGGGGWRPYFDIPKLDPGCKLIVKSPANTDLPGCGYMIASFSQPACAVLNLEKSFMLQFCCGNGDCSAAGASKMRRSAKFGGKYGLGEPLDIEAASGGMYSLVLRDANGTEITPTQVGAPPVAARREPSKPNADHPTPLADRGPKAKRSCDDGSWRADDGKAEYTRPADNTQIVARGVAGPGSVEITSTRSQSFTTSMNIGFADILSLGVGFEMTESVSDSTAHSFTVLEGQSGDVGFTSYMLCTAGSGRCNDGQVRGEICTPKVVKQGDDEVLDGIYGLIIHS